MHSSITFLEPVSVIICCPKTFQQENVTCGLNAAVLILLITLVDKRGSGTHKPLGLGHIPTVLENAYKSLQNEPSMIEYSSSI